MRDARHVPRFLGIVVPNDGIPCESIINRLCFVGPQREYSSNLYFDGFVTPAVQEVEDDDLWLVLTVLLSRSHLVTRVEHQVTFFVVLAAEHILECVVPTTRLSQFQLFQISRA